MFHPCSLAKVICANVTSDEWFMRHLREKAVNFYNVLNRKEGRRGDRQGGLGDRSGAWVLSSWRCEAPAPHLHWHPVCISLWYPAISPPPELTAVQRGSRAGRHNIQWLLCPMHCMVLQSVCASALFCCLVRASLHFKTHITKTQGFCWLVVFFLFLLLIRWKAAWKHCDVVYC